MESSVDKKTANTINAVAKALGVKVRFAEYGTVGGGKANAEIAQGIITIEKNNPNPLRFLFGHEITHRMQELASAEYDRLRAAIEARSGIAERVLLVQDNAAQQGDALSYEEALDEVVADEIGMLLEDSGEMERFIRKHSDDRTMLEKLRDVVRTIRRKLGNSPEAKRFRETEKLLSAALDKSVETVKKSEQTAEKNTTESGGVRPSIKNTKGMTLATQLKRYYDNKMPSSDAFYFGITPSALSGSGLGPYPLAMTIKDFRKSTKEKHDIPRRVLKSLADNLASPLFSFYNEDGAGVVIDDIDGTGKKIVVGIHKDSTMDRMPVNTIESVYGIDNPKEWIGNQIKDGKKFVLYNENRANAFLQTYGYLASVGEGIRSTEDKVSQPEPKVKGKFSRKDTYGRTLSIEQQEYFKDSKVRDASGNLKVMYHGTSKGGFTLFDYNRSNYGLFGEGSYFTDDPQVAWSYTAKGRGNRPELYEVYLDIKNPIDMDAPADANVWREVLPDADLPESGTNEQFYRAMEQYFEDEMYAKWEAASAATEVIQSMGFDGITHIGGGRFNKKDSNRHRVYIAFEPEQIKNTDNLTPTENPDIRYSRKDSRGRVLSEGQQEFFEGSKSRDANGNLKAVYQGSASDFTVFDRKKSRYSNLYGRGFYFTDSESHARQYGNTREFYLNITKPVSTSERTITKPQLRKFLEAVAENEDDYSFENYGYGATVDSVLDSVYGDKSDFALLYDVSQTAVGDMVETVELFNEVNGTDYDGLILDTETVAFYPEQIKRVDNLNPTNDSDIRYSRKDASYLAAVERGDTEAAQKMVDEAAKAAG